MLIRLDNVTRVYQVGRRMLYALRETSLEIAQGEFVAIGGPSGSGKSTLLNLIAGIDKPTTGRVLVGGRDITRLDENALARWRGAEIGIVFQFFQLLPTLTALENVVLPVELRGKNGSRAKQRERARAALARIGLGDRMNQLPSELSGGEQQRVAIARAVANGPAVILADEPTGNLDSETGETVIEHLMALSREHGVTLIVATHDNELSKRCAYLFRIKDGQVEGRNEAARGALGPQPSHGASD